MELEMKKKIVVTGASGMTGAALVLRLAAEGNNVVAFCRSAIPVFKTTPNISWCPGDIQDPAMLAAAFEGASEVYHLAAIANHWAPDPRLFYTTNVQGTINVLEAAMAAKVRRVVVTSSVGVIGPAEKGSTVPITEEHVRTVAFFNDYEASKAMMHERVNAYVRAGIDIVLVLPARVWGPGSIDPKNSVAYYLSRYFHNKTIPIPGNGKVVGNFVHVDDVVEGHILAMAKGRSGESYFLGGQNLTMDEITDHFEKFKQRRAKGMHVPFFLIRILAAVEGLLADWFKRYPVSAQSSITKLGYSCPVSSEKARTELGYEPMSFESALALAWAWLETGKGQWPVLPASLPSSPVSTPTPSLL